MSKASADGLSARQAAARFGVGVSSAIRWIARAKIGELTPRPQGSRRASGLDAYEPFIVGLIDERKDITLNIQKTYGPPVCKRILRCSDQSASTYTVSWSSSMAKMDIRAFRAPTSPSAPRAIFLIGLSKHRSTVRPSSRSFLQTSLDHVRDTA